MESAEVKYFHLTLSKYFVEKPFYLDEPSQKKPNVRKLVEQPWQETKGELWKELEETLTSLEYIETKCKAGFRYKLEEDYKYAIENWPGNEEKNIEKERLKLLSKYLEELAKYCEDSKWRSLPEAPIKLFPNYEDNNGQVSDNYTSLMRIQAWGKFISNNITRIGISESIIQLTHNYSKSGPIERKANEVIAENVNNTPWIKLLNRPQINSKTACIRTIKANKFDQNINFTMSADSKRIVTISAEGDYILKIWDLVTGEKEKSYYTTSTELLSTNGFIVASGLRLNKGSISVSKEEEQSLEIWDFKTFESIKVLRVIKNRISDKCSISQDGKLVAIIHPENGNLDFWEIDTGECIFTTNKSSIFRSVIFSPNSKYAVTNADSYGHYSVDIWDIENCKSHKCLSFSSLTGISTAITKDSKKLIVCCKGSIKNEIRIYNLDECEQISQVENTDYGALSITPDNKHALISGEKLFLWNLGEGIRVKVFHEPDCTQMKRAEITLDGRYAVTGEGSGVIRVWDLLADSSFISESHCYDVDTVKIIPVKNRVISNAVHHPVKWGDHLASDPVIRMWDLKNYDCTKELDTRTSDIKGLFVSPNQDQFIVCNTNIFSRYDFDGNLIEKYELKKKMNGAVLDNYHLKITPDGSRAVYEHWDENCGSLFIWDLSGTENKAVNVGNYEGKIRKINKIVNVLITHDGSKAVTTHYDKTICVWDLEHFKCLGQLSFDNLNETYINEECGCSISPDDKILVVQLYLPKVNEEAEKTTILWDLQKLEIVKKLGNSFTRTDQLDFMPDGRSYFSSGVSMGYSCNVTDIRTGKSSSLKNYEMGKLAALDNKHIVSFGNENLRIHNVSENSMLAQINNLGNGYKCYDIMMPQMIIGRRSGNISFLSLENFPIEPAIVTPVLLWLFSCIDKPGQWDKNVTTSCPWCRQRFTTPIQIINVIDGINSMYKLTPDKSPCLYLPDEAWEQNGLYGNCPNCGGKLKYNPFIAGGSYESTPN